MINDKKDIFKNRAEALDGLISILPIETMKKEPWHLISISTGGKYLASNLAKILNTEYEFLFTKVIFAPNNDESEIAIISETNDLIIHEQLVDAFKIDMNYIFGEARRGYERIIELIYKYRKHSSLSNINDKKILLVDDGAESGLTLMCAIKSLLSLGAKSISVALPVMPDSIVYDIQDIADDLYVIHKIEHFVNIDFYYKELL
jgi:putative phosphoribosyl transferase